MQKDKRLFERLIRMLGTIPAAPKTISAKALHAKLVADGFEVSKRTVERDLIQLSESFGILNDDSVMPQGWSWLSDSQRLTLPGLTPEEALTFQLVQSHLQGLMPVKLLEQLQPYFESAKQVLNNPLLFQNYAEWMHKVAVVAPWQPLIAPEIKPEVLNVVHQCLMRETQIALSYRSRSDDQPQARTVNPLGLIVRGWLTYLVCTIEPYNDVRLLVLHRIQSAKTTSHSANKPAKFELRDYLETGALGFSEKTPEIIKLQFRISKGAGAHLLESPLSSDQVILETDNSLEVTASVKNTMQLKWWILGFGAQLEVLQPTALRAQLKVELAQALDKYTQTSHES